MKSQQEPQILARFGLFPLSLAATDGIDVSFFSSRYLDVSVPWVRFHTPMNSAQDDSDYSETRFRIQKSPDRRLFASFPELIAGYHVFRRLSMPRHPPYTLSSLTTFIDHRQSTGRKSGAKVGRDRRYKRSITDHEKCSTQTVLSTSLSPKRCSTTPARNGPTCTHLQTEKPKTNGQKSRRFNCFKP